MPRSRTELAEPHYNNPYEGINKNDLSKRSAKTPSQLYDQATEMDNAEASVINITDSNIEG